MNLHYRREMEAAIRADLAHPGPISHAPSCECGCGRLCDEGHMIHRGAIYRPECFLLLENPAHCLFCGAEIKDGNFCDPDCFSAWDKRGL
jgi:hypothetical protein